MVNNTDYEVVRVCKNDLG